MWRSRAFILMVLCLFLLIPSIMRGDNSAPTSNLANSVGQAVSTGTTTSTITPSVTHLPTVTRTPSITRTITDTFTPSITHTRAPTVTRTARATRTATVTAVLTALNTATFTETATSAATFTSTSTVTLTQGMTNTSTVTPTVTRTRPPTTTRTITSTRAPTNTRTMTITRTSTATATPTQGLTNTSTVTVTTTSTAAVTASACTIFPSDNAWNEDVSALPIDPNSANYIASINVQHQFLHPDFGSDPTYGIPYVVVTKSQAKVPITFTLYGNQSDPGPYPMPLNAPVESGSDGHAIAFDKDNCILYELYQASRNATGWNASSGAIFNLTSDALRPDGWTSADAAGLPIYPGLARYDEVQTGVINHALRFTVQSTQAGYIHPATHLTGNNTNPNLPPMGLRLRLKASYDISTFTGNSLTILTALKKYGMIVADNGSSWYISGSTDTRWNDNDLNQLKGVPGSAFEVVTTGPILTYAP